STILSAGGGIVSKIGKISKAGEITKTGQQISRAGNIINPLSSARIISKPLKEFLPKISSQIEKSNWRLTKTKEGGLLTKMSDNAVEGASLIIKNKLNEVSDFMARQKIIGSPLKRYAEVNNLYNKTEDILDNFFGSLSKGSTLKKTDITRSLSGLKGAYKGTRDSQAITKQIDGAINTIKKDFGDNIHYKDLNKFKRTTFENAYNKAGDKVVDGIEHAIGDTIKGHLDEGLRGLKIAGQSFEEFNHNYGLLIEGRKILKMAVGKPEISAITERLLGGMLGYLLGGTAGGVSGGVGALGGLALGKSLFEAMPTTMIKSGIGAGFRKAGEMKIPAVIKGAKIPLTTAERLQEALRK
ncbi:MAG: hypothetical protein AAB890_00915, partial [Patescibacteria group bacterium]